MIRLSSPSHPVLCYTFELVVGSGSPGPLFDYNCGTNWLINGNMNGAVPCVNDMVQFPTGSDYWLYTSGAAVNSGVFGASAQPSCANNTIQVHWP